MPNKNNRKTWDPNAPIYVTNRRSPLDYMANYRKSKGVDVQELSSDSYYSVYIDSVTASGMAPEVAILISDMFYSYFKTRKVTIAHVRDFKENNSSLHDYENFVPIYRQIDQDPMPFTEHNFQLMFNKYMRGVSRLYANPKLFSGTEYDYRENDLMREKRVKLFDFYSLGIYSNLSVDKYLAVSTGINKVMVFQTINNIKDIDRWVNYWDSFNQNLKNPVLSESYSKWRVRDTSLAMMDLETTKFSVSTSSESAFNEEYSEYKDVPLYSLARIMADIIHATTQSVYRAVEYARNLYSPTVKVINMKEYMVSLLQFIIDYAEYFKHGEDKARLPIYTPIPLRILMSFRWSIPVPLYPNTLSVSEILNMTCNSDTDDRDKLIDALWKDELIFKPVSEMPDYIKAQVAPQLWHHGYYVGVRVPLIRYDGSVNKYKNVTLSTAMDILNGLNNLRNSVLVSSYNGIQNNIMKFNRENWSEIGTVICFRQEYVK